MDVIENDKAQYDAYAKRILSQKIILAHILSKCIKEYKDLSPNEIVNYIEENPQIDIPIDQSLTNSRIVGINNEDTTINEGLVRFDIVFYARIKDSLSKIIINIEAQKKEPTSYKILNRAIFYVSRLISSQKDRDFINSNYDDIKQVYSIWICMNKKQNSFTHYHLVKDDMLRPYDWKGNIDLFNIVILGITNDIQDYDDNSINRLLGTLFSSKLNTSEKLSIMKQEYNIPVDDKFREDVNVMCNLGEGIEEMAIERTTKEVTKKVTKEVTEDMTNKFVMNMYEANYTYNQISEVTKLSVEDVKMIIEKIVH